MKFESSLKMKLIYVFRINDEAHQGCLKIGEATCKEDDTLDLKPCCHALNQAAKERINQYTQTAGITYDLLYTEATLYLQQGKLCSFNDKEVHKVLLRSGIKRKVFDQANNANEWFCCDLETVKRAIAAVKQGRTSLLSNEIQEARTPIVFRPEQAEAIRKTEKQFKKGNQMLWNAKMRFGKTLSALQVTKDMNYQRTLILTHRPGVDEGWFDDFGKIFYDRIDYEYGSKHKGSTFSSLEMHTQKSFSINKKTEKGKYVYFASMQDLRGSELVGGKFDKNNQIFSTQWDLLIVDEAHEGTKTDLGQAVLKELIKPSTKVLRLSGTPFNLLDDFKDEEIYTWDYVMEQRAKAEWDILHQGDPNPYESLPKLNIYTYDLGRLLHDYADEDIAFNFHEFFRVDSHGAFVHLSDVKHFLDMLCQNDKDSLYPYSNEKFQNIFRHTLWMVPGVKAARALSLLLKNHPVFGNFKVVNVAGEGDEEENSKDALKDVMDAIGDDPDQTYTITLSCGRLTTGVSVKPWTGVFMLSGSYKTQASTYMQTIFRVQTPYTHHGKMKTQCYVFDFAPDRTLQVLAETAKVSAKVGKQTAEDRKIMGDFLNFCPVIAINGSKMSQYDVNTMMKQLKKVYVEKVVQNGFEDGHLYNDELLKLTDVELQEFDGLKKIIGKTKAMAKSITKRTLCGFRDNTKVNTRYFEDLINQITNKTQQFVEKVSNGKGYWKANEQTYMKFDAIVGNPPYQVMDGGAGVSAKPIYNAFVDISKKLRPSHISMIMPAKWYTDGKGLESFRNSMLNDNRIEKLVDFTDSRDCFKNVDIAGGICYFLWNCNHHGLCEFINKHQGESKTFMRKLSADESFIRHMEAVTIINKVKENATEFYSERVRTQKPFGLRTYVKPLDHGDIILKYNKGKGPYDSKLITIGKEMISQWKVIISCLTAEHAGQTDKEGRKKILSSLDMLPSNEHLSKEKFGYVPLQDFTSHSDINWSEPICSIDQQLYRKYALTADEIAFIEKTIKPM